MEKKRILLGITGGIAAYKSPDLVRRLKEQGYEVRVVLSEGGKAFITPLSLQAVSGHPVHELLLDPEAEAGMGHIELARWADVIVIAPASANCLAKLAHGLADDLLSTLCLATDRPIFLAPAMNRLMWANAATLANVKILTHRGLRFLGPAEGSQACGEVGPGRMLEPVEIAQALHQALNKGPLSGKKILITAGPTEEPIDPVRFITNRSSGKMGYALAQAALEAGAEVTLISGPVKLTPPAGVRFYSVRTAKEMLDAVQKEVIAQDIMIAAAAVADYKVKQVASQKIKKTGQDLHLDLIANVDIIGSVAQMTKKPFLVGFAAETESVLEHAKAKLKNKGLDMMVANDVSRADIGFESEHNAVTVLSEKGQVPIEKASKIEVARKLIALIREAL